MNKYIVSLFSLADGSMCTYFTQAEDKKQALVIALVEFLVKENYNLTETISQDGLDSENMSEEETEVFNDILDLFSDENHTYTLNEEWEIYFDVVEKPDNY